MRSAKADNATTSGNEGPSCTIYRPRTLGEAGRRHPIIIWGNGTGASPSGYGALLDHWASHGFVVAAARRFRSGNARLPGLSGSAERSQHRHLRGQAERQPRCGVRPLPRRGGTIMAGQDRRITVTAPFQPYTLGLGHRSSSQSNQSGPLFLMTGGQDTIAAPSSNAAPVYSRANVPVFWGELNSAGHLEPAGNAGGYRGPATAWLRFHLMGDMNAQSTFYGNSCGLCTNRAWTVRRKGI